MNELTTTKFGCRGLTGFKSCVIIMTLLNDRVADDDNEE